MTWTIETKTADVAPKTRDEVWATETTYVVMDERGRVVSVQSTRPATPFVIGGDEAESVARLIAAAPRLRAALQNLLNEVDWTAAHRGWSGNGARVEARSILALLDAANARTEVAA